VKTQRKKPHRKKSANSVFFEKINSWFLFLFILLLPTQLGRHFFFPFSYLSGVRVDYLAPTIFLTDILVVILIVLNIKAVLRLFKNKWVAAFLLLLAIGGLMAQSPEIFFYRFLKIIELLGVFAVFRYKKMPLKTILNAFFWGALFETGLVLLQFIDKHSIQGIFYFFGERYLNLSMPGIAKASLQGVEFLRPYGTFSHPNSLAGFYLLVYAFFYGQQKIQSPFIKKALLTLSFIIILFSFSKTALIAFFIILIFYLKDEFEDSECLPCIISKVVLYAVPIVIFALAKTDPSTLEKRYLLLQISLTLISQHLLFGVGPGNYLIAQSQLSNSSPASFPYQPVHNIFLLIAAETGLISTLFLGFFGLKQLVAARKDLVFIACCIVLILTGLLDHYWLTLQQNWLLIGVIFGVLAAGRESTE